MTITTTHMSDAGSRMETAETGIAFALKNQIIQLHKAERRGDLAELRRMDLARPSSPAFFRIVARVNEAADAQDMILLAHALRILALKPEALANGSLGRAMQAADVSEARVQRLLSARGEVLQLQSLMIARRLVNAGALPWRQLLQLVLNPTDASDKPRLIIARDYWTALERATSSDTSQTV